MEYYLSVKRNEILTRTTGFMNPEIFKWKKPDTKDHIFTMYFITEGNIFLAWAITSSFNGQRKFCKKV